MKKIIYTALFACLGIIASAQNLLDLYKRGTVKLIPDTEYAQNNDWDKVFRTYYDTIYNRPTGNRKSLIIMPDGSVVVNHAYRNYYSKFSPNGSFQKEFGITNSDGVRFKEIKRIAGIINNNTFYTGLDNMGNMVCFDFEGNYKKTLKLNYMTRQMIPLPNGKIAVVGWVIWQTRFKDFVAIIDYETNEEKVIWEHFTERSPAEKGGNNNKLFNYSYYFEKQGGVSGTSMPFSRGTGIKARPKLACVNNQLIVADPSNGELQIFDLNGKLISKKQMNLINNQISVEEQKDIQRKAIETYKKMNPLRFANKWISEGESKKAHDYFIKAMEADLKRITKPIEKPYFSTLIQDSDDNLLFFDYAKEQNANKFHVWVYKNGGEFICQSSFVCDDYDLQINPGKMVFHNGYIYGLQILKKSPTSVPLRLTRFKLTSK
ncbi:MAG: hypothetical protein GXO81_03025 [Chlorobi bacterium]|nr:hypothetical protein [Chlorobiota bacterium]